MSKASKSPIAAELDGAAAEPSLIVAKPLLLEVEALALRAHNSGNTEEHNLMAWLHMHLAGAYAAAASAAGLTNLSEEAQAVVAQVQAFK